MTQLAPIPLPRLGATSDVFEAYIALHLVVGHQKLWCDFNDLLVLLNSELGTFNVTQSVDYGDVFRLSCDTDLGLALTLRFPELLRSSEGLHYTAWWQNLMRLGFKPVADLRRLTLAGRA